MRILSVFLFLLFLPSLLTKALAQEPQQVFTLYFSGTSLNREMWQASASKFGSPETIASLHHFQIAQENSKGHHKGIVDGFTNWEVIVPDWSEHFEIGKQLIDAAFADVSCAKCIILNLVGFSRGAVSTMHMAHQLSTQPEHAALNAKIMRINILAFDPVPGDPLLRGENFNLPENVANYIGFYSEDERSTGFSPVFPGSTAQRASDNPIVRFFSIPGSHETMVGSIKEDGHSSGHNRDEDIASLQHLSAALKMAAIAIMGSAEWGRVIFDPSIGLELLDIESRKEQFEQQIAAIYSPDNLDLYTAMRRGSFALIGLEAWSNAFFFGKCAPVIGSVAFRNQRCVYAEPLADGRLGFPDGAIEKVKEVLPLNGKDENEELEIWKLIEHFYD